MSELKNIRDLAAESGYKQNIVMVGEVRAEAIRWVNWLSKIVEFEGSVCINCKKNSRDCNCKSNIMLSEYNYANSDITGALIMMKHFFDIKEEELQ